MGLTKGTFPMKKHKLRTPQMLAAAIAVGLKRFQIYRENINGTRILVQVINSETEAVEAFMRQAPVFEGGDIQLLDQHEQRMIAFAKWKMMTTEIGLPILHRVNVFHDWHLALLACRNENPDTSGEVVQPLSPGARILSERLHSLNWE
jgi:hypothetical protein